MGSHQGTPSGSAATPPAPAIAIVQALHVVLKNLAIYPRTHPRVAEAATAFVATLRQHHASGGPVVVQANGEGMRVGSDLAADGLRLPERLRLAGLRGVTFAADVGEDDVLAFADTLNRSRARAGKDFFTTWTEPNPRVEPLPLVYAGVHSDAAAAVPWSHDETAAVVAADGTERARGRGRRGVHGLVDRLASEPAVQQCLQAIELHACDPGEVEEREVDLLTAIADLLPADVTGDPDEVARAVTAVLTRVEQSLAELVRRNARVAGGELLRTALEVARRYFQIENRTHTTPKELPTGRPEDAAIVADLGLLLQELERLPDAHGLCLPRAEDLAESSALVAQRMCGIVLHALAYYDNPAIVAAALPRLRVTVPRILRDHLDLYLGKGAATAPIPANGAVRILETLVVAGHLELVREAGYVDAAFVARGFPHTLPLAASVLGDTAEGRRQFRAALQALRPVLQLGGADAAARTGILHQPAVVATLVATGGEVALQLLQHVAGNASDGERRGLFECARALALPQPEAAALAAVDRPERLPPDYLPLLFAAAARGDFTGAVRAATGAVLCDAVRRGVETLPHVDRLRAIETLLLVPGIETRTLLEELARRGRFTRFGSDCRELRACARRTLDILLQKASS